MSDTTTTTLLPFYKGDLVEVSGPLLHRPTLMRVLQYSERLSPHIFLTDDNRSFEFRTHCDNVKLVRRGNHFKLLFGMRDQLEFRSISHEVDFWREHGEMLELRNPANGFYYEWTVEEAIAALEAGTAHAFLDSSSLGLLLKPELGGFVCKNRDVAERLRLESLVRLRNFARQPVSA